MADRLDKINAYRAGFRHGNAYGAVSLKQAEEALKALPTTIPIVYETVECFRSGAEDGANRDTFRFLLAWPFMVTAPWAEVGGEERG